MWVGNFHVKSYEIPDVFHCCSFSLLTIMPSDSPWIPFLTVNKLIASNDPPSDDEKHIIVTVMHKAQQIIDQMDVPGDGNSLALQQAAESDRLKFFIKSGCAILSPVRRVPSEVLGSIMNFSTYDVSSDVAVGPLHFTSVSKLWRQTAKGFPSLWSKIQVKMSTNRTNPGLANLIEEILARSKRLPLSVTLSLEGDNEVSIRLLDLLVAESDRWASFSIDLDRHEHFLRILPTMTLTPHLKSNHVISLSLVMGYEGNTVQLHLPNLLRLETSNSILAIGGNLPELRELFLYENIVWRELHINNVLSNSTKLQYLTLSEWGPLTSFYSDHLFRILHAAAPSLEVLRLYPRGRPENQNKNAIFSLIARLTLRHVGTHNQTSFPVLPRLTHILLHLPKQLAYSVRLISGSEMESEIRSRASNLAVSPDFRNSRLQCIWIQDGSCSAGTSRLRKYYKEQIVDGVEVCIARPLVPAIGWEVGLVVLSSSGEIISVLGNYM